MSKLRRLVKFIIPYGIIKKREEHFSSLIQEPLTFVQMYNTYVQRNNRISFAERNRYSSVISVQGFGYSGSGAVVDLLREYEDVLVMGNVDREGSVIPNRRLIDNEVDILRLSGGLLEIEKYISSNNIFQNDALLHRFVQMMYDAPIFRDNDIIKDCTFEFFSKICEFSIPGLRNRYYNTYLPYKENDIFFLKHMSLSEYRNECRRYLATIFNLFAEQTDKILVLDQFFSDGEKDIQRNQEYVPNLKTIVVYRDLRDIFVFARQIDVEWIPHDNVESFIKWIKITYNSLSKNENKDLKVRFEDLVYNYDKTVNTIEQYLNIHSASHIRKFSALNPEQSSKNIGIWKNHPELVSDFARIKKEFPSLCYQD